MEGAYKWEDGVLEYVGGVSGWIEQGREGRIKAVLAGLQKCLELRRCAPGLLALEHLTRYTNRSEDVRGTVSESVGHCLSLCTHREPKLH